MGLHAIHTIEKVPIFYTIFQRIRIFLFISFFLYFIIVRKSIRTVMEENDEINDNKEISFGISKKRDLLI
jgi:hypothetical protein